MNKEQGTTKRILIVFEFCVSLNESMVPEVRGEWEKRGGRVTYLQGLFRTYRAGGMRFSRLLNLGWMFFWLPWVLLVLRPFKVLVRTTPPGIQIWAALWMKILRIKVKAKRGQSKFPCNLQVEDRINEEVLGR